MQELSKTFFGDPERWAEALKQITDKSKEPGDQRDLVFLEYILKNEPPPIYTTEDKIALDKAIRRMKARLKDESGKYKLLLESYEKLDDLYNSALIFEELPEVAPIPAPLPGEKGRAVAFIQFSDWHLGETVDPDTVNGLNKYDPDVARSRVTTLLGNCVSTIQKEKKAAQIEAIVVHLGGDFINGWIHAENTETNSMTPTQEVEFAAELLIGALKTIAELGIPVTVVCNVGNHGRYTKKFRFANEIHTSFETLLYNMVARELKDLVQIIPPTSTLMYYEVMGQTCRFFHGHQVRYKDGVGGLTIPLNKRVFRWDATKKADFNFMGHYHTVSMPNVRTLLNGSLVGYNGLAQFAGFEYERAQQAFIMYHSDFGWTGFQKLLAE